MFAAFVLGCLPSFAPNLRAKGVHAGLDAGSGNDSCMGCHISEGEALAQKLEGPAAAPLVADWMLEDRRSCAQCHVLRAPRGGSAQVQAHTQTQARLSPLRSERP